MEEEIPKIIQQIVEEDEVLQKRQEEMEREAYGFLVEGNFDIKKAQEFFENLPSVKIAKILAEIIYRNQSTENLREMLKKELEISETRAMEIEEKIKERILKPLTKTSQSEESFLKEEQQKEIKEIEKRTYDPYREPLEELDTRGSAISQERLTDGENEDKILEEKIRKIIGSEEPTEELEEEKFSSQVSEITKSSSFPEIKIEKRERKVPKTEEKKETFFKSRKIDPYREIPE